MVAIDIRPFAYYGCRVGQQLGRYLRRIQTGIVRSRQIRQRTQKESICDAMPAPTWPWVLPSDTAMATPPVMVTLRLGTMRARLATAAATMAGVTTATEIGLRVPYTHP